MSAGPTRRASRAPQERLQIRCSVDKDMDDIYGRLAELSPTVRGRELVAAARIGWALRGVGAPLAALVAAVGAGAQTAAGPAAAPNPAPTGAGPGRSGAAPEPAPAAVDLSLAAAQHATAAFDPAFFSAAPSLQ